MVKSGGVAKRGNDNVGAVAMSDGAAAAAAADAVAQQDGDDDTHLRAAPSGECVRTTNAALQAKLEQCAALCAADDAEGLCAIFLPLDLTKDEADGFALDLKSNPAQWSSLKAELTLLADGRGVYAVIGDQVNRAEFRFLMPNRSVSINREVVFTCVHGEWRAEG